MAAGIRRQWADDVRLVVSLLSPNRPKPEDDLLAILRYEYEWGVHRAKSAVGHAQNANLIRWVAFSGWVRGGRPV